MNDETSQLPADEGPADEGIVHESAIEAGASCELEQALATLRPSAGPIDRDRLMFLAGRAIGERTLGGQPCAGLVMSKWLWPSATAVSTLAATVLGVLLMVSHRPLVVREPAHPHEAVPRQAVPPTQFEPYRGGLPPGTMASDNAGMASRNEIAAAPVETARIDIARVDFIPRTKLPRPSYFQKREVALSLGVEALGSPLGSGRAEEQVAYREWLSDMVDGME